MDPAKAAEHDVEEGEVQDHDTMSTGHLMTTEHDDGVGDDEV